MGQKQRYFVLPAIFMETLKPISTIFNPNLKRFARAVAGILECVNAVVRLRGRGHLNQDNYLLTTQLSRVNHLINADFLAVRLFGFVPFDLQTHRFRQALEPGFRFGSFWFFSNFSEKNNLLEKQTWIAFFFVAFWSVILRLGIGFVHDVLNFLMFQKNRFVDKPFRRSTAIWRFFWARCREPKIYWIVFFSKSNFDWLLPKWERCDRRIWTIRQGRSPTAACRRATAPDRESSRTRATASRRTPPADPTILNLSDIIDFVQFLKSFFVIFFPKLTFEHLGSRDSDDLSVLIGSRMSVHSWFLQIRTIFKKKL